MTDNKIIKALENEIHLVEYVDGFSANNVSLKLLQNSLELIYRQKAEIERLEKTEIEIDDFCRRLCRMRMLNGNAIASYEDLQNYIQEEKSKAITEFAERLKQTITNEINTYYNSNGGGYYLAEDTIEDIDNLVKEMTGNAE